MDPNFPTDPLAGGGAPEDDPTPVAIVATQQALPLWIEEAEDERAPEGMVCMVTYLGERVIARSIVIPEALEDLEERAIFEEPRQLGLAAVEREPGIQGRLFALVPAIELREELFGERDEDQADEPWVASVPRFEDIHEDRPPVDPNELVPILLGHIVRFAKDRKHPADLSSEAADILQAIVSEDRQLKTIVDKMLEDLFDG